MAQATDAQMQAFADQRVRVRAEQLRAVVANLRDDKASLDAVYDRAANGSAWSDSRTDGPPKLLASADMLAFNSVITALIKIADGIGTTDDCATIKNNWPALMAACVRPVV